jgi:hypothetical protein
MMDRIERLEAMDEIRQAKAKYFRGVDTGDSDLVRGVLAEDCVLDYMGCCTDPATGRDFFPAMNVVMRGRASWSSEGFGAMGIVSAHHGHNCEIAFTGETTADVVWSMTDRLFKADGDPFRQMTGYGYYRETYEKGADGRWRIKALRIVRTRVEGG